MQYLRLELILDPPLARLVLLPAQGAGIGIRALSELSDAAATLQELGEVRALIVEARGPDFCAGWEPEARQALLESALSGDGVDPFGPLAELPFPVLAALHGRVASAGLELALACDLRIAASDALFAMPETAEGLVPLAGGTQRLPRAVGRARAASMLLLGEELDAEAALRAGLVSRVVPREQLGDEATAIALRIAERGPIAERYAKEAVHRGLEMPLEQALRYETDLTIILQTTQDRAEGVRAFLERRQPRFEGR